MTKQKSANETGNIFQCDEELQEPIAGLAIRFAVVSRLTKQDSLCSSRQ